MSPGERMAFWVLVGCGGGWALGTAGWMLVLWLNERRLNRWPRGG